MDKVYSSLSARRAWIEILSHHPTSETRSKSLSARRAWIEIPTNFLQLTLSRSLSARRAWIEIVRCGIIGTQRWSRSPQGERGLKSSPRRTGPSSSRRSPQGERGLKSAAWVAEPSAAGRSPQGERGLKSGNGDDDRPKHCGRSPQGERGLKSTCLALFNGISTVALRKESVD